MSNTQNTPAATPTHKATTPTHKSKLTRKEKFLHCWDNSRCIIIFFNVLLNLMFFGGITLLTLSVFHVLTPIFLIIGAVLLGVSTIAMIILGIMSCISYNR